MQLVQINMQLHTKKLTRKKTTKQKKNKKT